MSLSEPWGVVKGAPRILVKATLPDGREVKRSSGFRVSDDRVLLRGLPASLAGSMVEVTPATIIGTPTGPTVRARVEKAQADRDDGLMALALS
jgi:hypothetical protein